MGNALPSLTPFLLLFLSLQSSGFLVYIIFLFPEEFHLTFLTRSSSGHKFSYFCITVSTYHLWARGNLEISLVQFREMSRI